MTTRTGIVQKLALGHIAALRSTIEGKVLGQLLWYTVGDLKVDRATLETLFSAHGLDPNWLPKAIRPVYAFRRATASMEAHRIPLAQGRSANLLVRELRSGTESCVRQLVREVVDAENRRLEYLPTIEWELTRADDALVCRRLTSYLLYEEEQRFDALPDTFAQAKRYYSGQHIRMLLNDLLDSLAAVSVRPSGGVYFVPAQYEGEVRALQAVAKALGAYGTNEYPTNLHSVPLIDTEEQRSMVTESLTEHVAREGGVIAEELRQILTAGKEIGPRAAERALERVKGLRSVLDEYRALLEDELVGVSARWEIAQMQVRAILERTGEEESA